jgi:hypothetical protein
MAVEAAKEAQQRDEAPFAERVKRKWYEGELNRTYKAWRDSGRPEDPDNPLLKELLSEAHLFASRLTRNAQLPPGSDLDESFARIQSDNEEDIQKALRGYDPHRLPKASFATYIKKAVLNNILDEVRDLKTPTHQKELLRAFNGYDESAHAWIEEYKDKYSKKGGGYVQVPGKNIRPEDQSLAHWLVDQAPRQTITWRHVLAAFPNYRTEDTAGRALRRVKKAIEKAGFYKF